MRLVLSLMVLTAATAPAYAKCGPPLDSQMVRVLPRTPSSGPNPLFRLVGGHRDGASTAASCNYLRKADTRAR